MKLSDAILKVKERLTPETWGQGGAVRCGLVATATKECVGTVFGALEEELSPRPDFRQQFRELTGIPVISEWNDTHTYPEIMAALDLVYEKSLVLESEVIG